MHTDRIETQYSLYSASRGAFHGRSRWRVIDKCIARHGCVYVAQRSMIHFSTHTCEGQERKWHHDAGDHVCAQVTAKMRHEQRGIIVRRMRYFVSGASIFRHKRHEMRCVKLRVRQ